MDVTIIEIHPHQDQIPFFSQKSLSGHASRVVQTQYKRPMAKE
jgi:hypothetical protein